MKTFYVKCFFTERNERFHRVDAVTDTLENAPGTITDFGFRRLPNAARKENTDTLVCTAHGYRVG